MDFQSDSLTDGIPVNTIFISYVESSVAEEIKLHHHNNYQIIYICEGCVEFIINKKSQTVGKNSIIFINHLESHELKILQFPYKRFIIYIKPHYLSSVVSEPQLVSIFKNRPEGFIHAIRLDEKDSDEMKSLIGKMHEEASSLDDLSLTAVGSYMQLLLITLYRKHKNCFPLTGLSRSFNLVMNAQRYIEENILEQITLKSAAKKFYTDMYYLSHLFKEVSGYTFKEYLILQRISRAKDLLIHTNQNITEVAINSGFNNVNHFIRIFKKLESITPLQYRKKIRQK